MPVVIHLQMCARFRVSSSLLLIIICTIYIRHFRVILSILYISLCINVSTQRRDQACIFIAVVKTLKRRHCQNPTKKEPQRGTLLSINLRACGPPCTQIRFVFISYVYIVVESCTGADEIRHYKIYFCCTFELYLLKLHFWVHFSPNIVTISLKIRYIHSFF